MMDLKSTLYVNVCTYNGHKYEELQNDFQR